MSSVKSFAFPSDKGTMFSFIIFLVVMFLKEKSVYSFHVFSILYLISFVLFCCSSFLWLKQAIRHHLRCYFFLSNNHLPFLQHSLFPFLKHSIHMKFIFPAYLVHNNNNHGTGRSHSSVKSRLLFTDPFKSCLESEREKKMSWHLNRGLRNRWKGK